MKRELWSAAACLLLPPAKATSTMSTKVVGILLAALLLHWCQVPTRPTSAAKTPVAGRGSRRMKVRMIPRIEYIDHCRDKKHSLIIRNFSNRLEKDGTQNLDVNFDLTASALRLMAFRLKVFRCPVGVGGKCEYFNTWSWNMPVCNLLTSKGMMWSPMYQNTHPTFKCPVQKGSYAGRNMTLDLASVGTVIESLNLDKYSWPSETLVFSENGLYMCIKISGDVRLVRGE